MRVLAWICVCSTCAALVPLEPFGVPRRAAPLAAGKRKGLPPYTPLPEIMTSAAVDLLLKLNLLGKVLTWMDSMILTEEQHAEIDRRRQERWGGRPPPWVNALRESLGLPMNTTDRPGELGSMQKLGSLPNEGELGSMQKLGFLPNEAKLPHKAYQSESPPRAPERQLDPETNQQQSDQLYRELLVRMGQREQASALEGVGRLEQLSTSERYHAVEAAHQAFTRLDQEFDRLERSEPPTDGELQAARSLRMRLGEAFEHWGDMVEKLNELVGNEEELRDLKFTRARFALMYGRLDTRARLERAFLDES